MVRGVSADTVSSVLRKIPLRKRLEVADVTTDLFMLLDGREGEGGYSLSNQL